MRSPEETLEALTQLRAHHANTARKLIQSGSLKKRDCVLVKALSAEVIVRLFLMAAQKQLPPK